MWVSGNYQRINGGFHAFGADDEEGTSCAAQGMLYDEEHDSCYTVESSGSGTTSNASPTSPPPSTPGLGITPWLLGAATVGLVGYWVFVK